MSTTKRKTTEVFKNEVYELEKENYTVIGEYKNNKTKILMKHNICGYEYEVTPNSFLYGSRCPKCSAKKSVKDRTKTTEEFREEIKSITNGEYEVLGNYKNNKTKITFKHNSCLNSFDMRPGDFINNGNRCPICSRKNRAKQRSKTTEEFKQEVYNLVGDDYIVIDEYKNSNSPIKIKHCFCETEYLVRPSDFLKKNGNRCPKCYGTPKKTTKEFKQEVYNLVGDEYKVLGEYKNNHTKIKMMHEKCGKCFEIRPLDFLKKNGNRCINCKHKSKGVEIITNWLIENNIEYENEFRFRDCKNIRTLPFDFKIILKSELILIEFDGEQHFYPNFGNEHFKKQKINDDIKNNYCKENNIKLIRISYEDIDNICDILNKELLSINL